MLKEFSNQIHDFIRKNRYRKAIFYCEICDKSIMINNNKCLSSDVVLCKQCFETAFMLGVDKWLKSSMKSSMDRLT